MRRKWQNKFSPLCSILYQNDAKYSFALEQLYTKKWCNEVHIGDALSQQYSMWLWQRRK